MTKPDKPDSPKTEIIDQPGKKAAPADMDELVTTMRSRVAGNLVITEGPGKGRSIAFYEGSNSIGRDGVKNAVALDLGDAIIRRESHAYLTCLKRVCRLATGASRSLLRSMAPC